MIDRTELRRLVIERRDCQADAAAARLALMDAEAAGTDTDEMRQRVAALEARDRELAYAQRILSAEIASAEAQEGPEPSTPLGAG